MTTLSFDPLIPPALWVALALAGAAFLTWYGWRRPGALTSRRWAAVLAFMATGLALVLVILLNPTWLEPLAPPAGPPRLTVLVDASASMATPDAGSETRYRAAARIAQAFAAELSGTFDVHVATFADKITSASPDGLDAKPADGPLTDLAAALTGCLDEERSQGQAVVLVSDGIHNAGGGAERVLDAARLAKALACPVYTRTLGGDAAVRDVALELRSPQEIAFVGQKVTLAVQVRQRGFAAGGPVTVTLTHDGKEVERKTVPLPAPDVAAEVSFPVSRDKTGLYRYEARAAPLPEEVSRANNAATLVLRVVDKPVRVLLLEGKPYWDGKFLARTLLADPSVELDTVVRLSPGRYLKRTVRRAAPGPTGGAAGPTGQAAPAEEWAVAADGGAPLADAASLKTYQVVVLGRDADAFLTDAALAQLRTWIARDGGSLVCARGQPASEVGQRLGQLLPLRWAPARETRIHVTPTDRGRDLHWLPGEADAAGATLPTLATAARPERPKPLAVVLATAGAGADQDPAVTYQPYGTGRVVVVEGSGMWRWAFLPPPRQPLDDVYRGLWLGLLRWLASGVELPPGQKLALRGDKVRFATTEPATATLLVRAEDAGTVPAVELIGPGIDGSRAVRPAALGDEPGVFRVAFGPLPEGSYRARVVGEAAGDPAAETAFDVRSPADEQLDLRARPDLMERIARESGGAVLTADRPADVVAQFTAERDRGRAHRVVRLTAWDRWWVLVAVFGVWATAWGLRRSGGLV